MSEAEKSRRQDYRRVRKKWIAVQAVILAVAFLVAVISLSLSFLLDNEHYINYKESSKVDYGVFLKENEFYKESYLGSDKTYVASLINRVAADFTHTLNVDSTEAMNFQYTYGVEAELQIVDKLSGGVLYAPVYEVIPEKTLTADGTGFVIRERVVLNYDDYNALANRFIATYDLTGVESNIVLRMQVSSNYTEPYTSSLEIPLTTKTVHVQMAATTPAGDGQILIKGDSIASFVASVIAYVFLGVALLLGIEIVLFTYLTRNTDITYEIRVSRILKAYKSFIQKINNAFRTDGYQILMVDTFREMLEIRDTIQSPILMNENEDKTCTRFLIPTNTKLLYVYELKIEDYDEIYAQPDESSPEPEVAFAEVAPEMPAVAAVVECSVEPIAVDEPIVEEPVVEETVAEEPVAEAEAATVEPVAVIADPAEESEEASAFSNVRRSFMAKLIQCEEESKLYFSELKNSLLTYRGVKARTSWGAETFNKGRRQLAKITMRGKPL